MSESILGFDEAGRGPVLLLVHGFPLDRRMWSRQLEALADVRRCIAVDLRGRGRSGHFEPGGWRMEDYADDVDRTIQSVGVEQADVAGLSMGGYVAMALWGRRPERIRSLILIDTRPGEDSPEQKERRLKTAELVREKGTAPLIEGMLPSLFGRHAPDEVREEARRMCEETPGETAALDSLAMRDRPDFTADLTSVEVPALVAHGVEDEIVPFQAAEQMAALIPGARLVPVPNAGHLAPMENPDAVNAALREFLLAMDAAHPGD